MTKVSIIRLATARGTAFQLAPQLSGTKLGHSITKNDLIIKKALEPYYKVEEQEQEEIEKATIMNAATDTAGVLLYTLTKNAQGQEQKVYNYTKEGELDKNNEIRAIQKKYSAIRNDVIYTAEGEEKEVTITPLMTMEYPTNFPAQYVEQFKDIYLTPDAKERVEIKIASPSGQPVVHKS